MDEGRSKVAMTETMRESNQRINSDGVNGQNQVALIASDGINGQNQAASTVNQIAVTEKARLQRQIRSEAC